MTIGATVGSSRKLCRRWWFLVLNDVARRHAIGDQCSMPHRLCRCTQNALVSAPTLGGSDWKRSLRPSSVIGSVGAFALPPLGRVISTRPPDWLRCGSSASSSGDRIGANGKPRRSKIAESSSADRSAIRAAIIGKSHGRAAERSVFVASRGSFSHSRRPNSTQKSFHCPSPTTREEELRPVSRIERIIDCPGAFLHGPRFGRLARDCFGEHRLRHQEHVVLEQRRLNLLAAAGASRARAGQPECR